MSCSEHTCSSAQLREHKHNLFMMDGVACRLPLHHHFFQTNVCQRKSGEIKTTGTTSILKEVCCNLRCFPETIVSSWDYQWPHVIPHTLQRNSFRFSRASSVERVLFWSLSFESVVSSRQLDKNHLSDHESHDNANRNNSSSNTHERGPRQRRRHTLLILFSNNRELTLPTTTTTTGKHSPTKPANQRSSDAFLTRV